MAEYKKIISYGFKTSMSFTKISIMKDFFSLFLTCSLRYKNWKFFMIQCRSNLIY